MKLAEALSLRSDLQKRVESLATRIQANATHLEGEESAEDPNELLEEATRRFGELETLIATINKTNLDATIRVDGTELSLTEALARRDMLTRKHKLLTLAASATSGEQDRVWGGRRRASELKTVQVLNVKELREWADDVARNIRELDVKVQQKNWEVDIDVEWDDIDL